MKIRSPVPRKRTRIEIIPLIDIMFFLLASFMMVSLQMHKVQTVKASLPTATLAKPTTKPDMINLLVDKYGQQLFHFFFGSRFWRSRYHQKERSPTTATATNEHIKIGHMIGPPFKKN